MPVPLKSQQVEPTDDITGSRERRSWSWSQREPGAAWAADMEGRGVGGSGRPGTPAGLGPLPMPHGISQTGAPSKVRPLKLVPPIPDPWSHTLHTLQAPWCPQLRGWHSSLPTKQGLGKQGTLGSEGVAMGHPERDGASHLQDPMGEPWTGYQGTQLSFSFAV